jgi:PAS domain S-box-containing protein
MGVEYVLAISTLLQLVIGLLALRLVWVTSAGKSWALIAAAMLLMCVRRLIALFGFLSGEHSSRHAPDLAVEWIALFISALMLAGIIGIAPLFRGARQSAESLRESQRKLSTLMANLPGMAYRCRNDRDWTMEFVSQGSVELTGYQPSDLVDNRVKAYNDLIHPDHRQAVWDQVQKALAERRPFQLTYRIRTASGEEKWVWEQGRGVFSDKGEMLALEGFITDITERRQAEEMLQRAHDEVELMAYEIHDGLAQKLAGALMHFQAMDLRNQNIPENMGKEFNVALQLLRDSMIETRRLIAGLRPPVLDEAGLTAAIEYLAAETTERCAIEIDFQKDVQFTRLASTLESAIFRIVQECLNNACNHSQSKKVRISLAQRENRLRVEIEDWGRGFDPAQVPPGHYGLTGIRQRARLVGGQAEIESTPGKGARITVDLPLTV